MNRIAFTLCSNNFLAQAKTLIDSLREHNPGLKIFLFLVDKKDASVDYSFFPATVIVVDESVVTGFNEMARRYDILELNSNLKPHLFAWLAMTNPDQPKIFYLDADTFVYASLDDAHKLLDSSDIILTPHFVDPAPVDEFCALERLALNYGVYNMGFIAINAASENTKQFLNWWGKRTFISGLRDVANGFFVDQLWVNLVPVYFEKVHTLKHKGYNMAPWNLYEREIQSFGNDGKIILSSGVSLVQFHFSSFNFFKPGMGLRYSNNDFSNTPHLEALYARYSERLAANHITEFSKLQCRLPIRKTRKIGALRRKLYPIARKLRNIGR
jgi:hypothetical protein